MLADNHAKEASEGESKARIFEVQTLMQAALKSPFPHKGGDIIWWRQKGTKDAVEV